MRSRAGRRGHAAATLALIVGLGGCARARRERRARSRAGRDLAAERHADASPDTQISFLGVAANEIAGVSVRGSRTGTHTASSRLRDAPPAPASSSTTSSRRERASPPSALSGRKAISAECRRASPSPGWRPTRWKPGPSVELNGHGLEQSFQSQPQAETAGRERDGQLRSLAGDIFLTPTAGYGQSGPMIVDGQGRLVWFHPVPKGMLGGRPPGPELPRRAGTGLVVRAGPGEARRRLRPRGDRRHRPTSRSLRSAPATATRPTCTTSRSPPRAPPS